MNNAQRKPGDVIKRIQEKHATWKFISYFHVSIITLQLYRPR